MQWTSVNGENGHTRYILWENKKKLLSLEFHHSTSWVRVKSAKEKRVLLIRSEGVLRKKAVMRNEYGIIIGRLYHENRENHIEVNNKDFSCTFNNTYEPEFRICREPDKDHVTACKLNLDPLYFAKNKKLPEKLESGMLLSLCWHLAQPVVKVKESELSLENEL
ncbi:MAG: hypothetical protein B6D37_04095 [Sphingobacteriales bacterium UTBCD1]|jgi:hypothetical protein|nr:MAG: hypothetical protein B6D37_04095 [Sphingobacteriales bacterium UTBCD1]